MRDFRELKVWGKAHSLTLDLYKMTRTFPKDELGTSVFWNQPAFQEATKTGVEDNTLAYQERAVRRPMYTQAHQDGRVERRAELTVFFFSEVTLL